MCIDHVGAIFPSAAPIYFRWIGRISMPIFAYLIAEGCAKSKDINRYTIRLFLFALLSEIPFDLAFGQPVDFLHNTNVFYTLFLGAACVNGYEKLRTRINPAFALMPALPLIYLGSLLETDYGSFGVLWILILYLMPGRRSKWCALICGIIYLYGLPNIWNFANINVWSVMLFVFAMISAVLIFFYKGKQGPKWKWFFYCFYPVHLSVLACLFYLWYN